MTEITETAAAASGGKKRATFNTLRISQVRNLTENSIEVTFEVPEELVDDYNYAPGQYVAVRAELDGKEVRRSYSICGDKTPGEIKIAIKRDLGGLFSNWANDNLKAGTTLEVMNPTGAFIKKHGMTELNDPEAMAAKMKAEGINRFAAVAAGSGITPIIAIIRSVLATDDSALFELIYANRTASDVMFVEELADLKDKYPARLAVHHVLSREQRQSPTHSGRVDADKIKAMFGTVFRPEKADEWFLCGPFELVQLLRDTLNELGVPEEKVRYELFSTGKPEDSQGNVGRPVVVDPAGDNFQITFNLDGLEGEVKSPKAAKETILNAALRVRADVPFACAGGVCGTCRAKVVEGSVEMAENYALEPDEVERGYVLTCQARPTCDSVKVDFDA